MAENKMKQVAKLLGVEIGEKFEIKGVLSNPYHFSEIGLVDRLGRYCCAHLTDLLNGEIGIQKSILTQREKEYLEGVLKPFKDNVVWIQKISRESYEYLNYRIKINDGFEYCCMPSFESNKMYRGMKANKEYSLEDLRLFEES
jgi:hypothetical protein